MTAATAGTAAWLGAAAVAVALAGPAPPAAARPDDITDVVQSPAASLDIYQD